MNRRATFGIRANRCRGGSYLGLQWSRRAVLGGLHSALSLNYIFLWCSVSGSGIYTGVGQDSVQRYH